MFGCLKCVFGLILLHVLVIAIGLYWLNNPNIEPLNIQEEWWGQSPETEDSVRVGKPEKFEIKVEPAAIESLINRLKNSRISRPLDDVQFQYGMNSNYLKKVIEHWVNNYDFEKELKRLNSYPQFMIEIDGLKVHYIHVKPNNAKNKKIVPLMMVHGWPGSVAEFYKAIEILTNPSQDSDVVFEVICPHIPGYGFSEAPHKSGFNVLYAAKMFDKLMKGLGHDKYYIQGGDWGGFITSVMSIINPSSVKGLYLNFIPVADNPVTFLKWLVGSIIPQVFPAKQLNSDDLSVGQIFSGLLQESGYLHIQATKPDTVGVGLSDSPAGLAAYILEKFAGWTNLERSLSRVDGGLEESFKLDELLSNVMIYWLSNSITSSMRFYKENFSPKFSQHKVMRRPVTPPSGILLCNKEPFNSLAILGLDIYKNLLSIDHENCGHFAALEKPKELSRSLRSFVSKVERMKREEKKANEEL